jgi:hypothetical protein
MKQDFSQQVTEILESLNQVKRATAPAFFYTRLRARMENSSSTSTFLLRPAFTLLAMLLLFMANSFLVVNRAPQPSVADVMDKEDTLHWTNEYASTDLYPINESYADWTSSK